MPVPYCFVIMPFKPEFRDTYDYAIKIAIMEAGLECVRSDDVVGTISIHRQIIEGIAGAKVVVADVSGQNPNVCYELGIAHSLGSNVIVLARSTTDLMFDIATYKVIIYTDSIGGGHTLKGHLADALATFDQWSAKPSNPVQDFLPPGARPVSAEAHRMALERLEDVRTQLAAVQAKLSSTALQEADLNQLRAENLRLQGASRLIEGLKRAGLFGDGPVGDDAVDTLLEQVMEKGEVTVPLEVGPERPAGANRITFTKVVAE
jgi:hypothetical protein